MDAVFCIPIFNGRQKRKELQGGRRSVSELSHIATTIAAVSLCSKVWASCLSSGSSEPRMG